MGNIGAFFFSDLQLPTSILQLSISVFFLCSSIPPPAFAYHHPMQLWLVRHAETAQNRAGIYQGGGLNPPLSQKGHRQARALADWLGPALAQRPRAHVFVSPQQRAAQTAAPLCAAAALDPTPLDWLRELHYGHWEGLTLAEIEARHGAEMALWRTAPQKVAFEGGETLAAFRNRTRRGLARLLKQHGPGDTLVFVAHSGTLRMLTLNLLAMPLSAFRQLRLANVSLTRFVTADGRFALESFNQTPAEGF